VNRTIKEKYIEKPAWAGFFFYIWSILVWYNLVKSGGDSMKVEEKANVVYSFSAQHTPVAELTPGEILVVETADCFSGQIHEPGQCLDKIDMERINPVTGPFYVSGAEPGDILEVEILEIKTAGQGVIVIAPHMGVLGNQVNTPVVKIVKLSETNAVFAEDLSIPLQPMVGVIGVAPQEGEVSCGSPGQHGGNLDTKEIRPGSKVYLPVFHPGALLALGDVHALMGDGEISGYFNIVGLKLFFGVGQEGTNYFTALIWSF